jgi:hypothetical protein
MTAARCATSIVVAVALASQRCRLWRPRTGATSRRVQQHSDTNDQPQRRSIVDLVGRARIA